MSSEIYVEEDKKVCSGCKKVLPLTKFQRLYNKDKKFIGYRSIHRSCDRGRPMIREKERIDTKVNNLRLDLDNLDTQSESLFKSLNAKISSLNIEVRELRSQVKQLSVVNKEP